MSFDIYAKPDLSKKVRYNRKAQEDEVEWEEKDVDIYESADAIGHDYTDIQPHEGGTCSEEHPEAVRRRPYSAAVLCLGVLCCLMLAGIITLSIHSTLEKARLQRTLLDDNSQLNSSYVTLSKNYSQLQDEIKQLKGKIEGKWCPEGWERFGCSCYFKSSEKKTWYDSRSDCWNKGADLVVINDKEEQKFLTKLNVYGEFWIGLQATKEKWNTGRRVWEWEWEWVDGSPLTKMFRESGLPQYSGQRYAAAYCDQQGQWTHADYYSASKHWICEK